MTSFRQIEANQRNAAKSTGPNTEEGKRRSRQNAVRHGLCAETVVEIVEDVDDYRGFEAAIIADYDARTAVERELVLRLASLLWRLRRYVPGELRFRLHSVIIVLDTNNIIFTEIASGLDHLQQDFAGIFQPVHRADWRHFLSRPAGRIPSGGARSRRHHRTACLRRRRLRHRADC